MSQWFKVLSDFRGIGLVTRVRYLLVLTGLISIWLNYRYNLSVRLGQDQINDFIDIVIVPSDLWIIGVYALVVFTRWKWVRLLTVLSFIQLLVVAFILNDSIQINDVWQWFITFSNIGVWLWLVVELWKNTAISKSFRAAFFSGLISLSLFDYFLISHSIVLAILTVTWLFVSTPINRSKWYRPLVVNGLGVWFVVNGIVGFLQILLGRNIGLRYIGEPFLNIDTIGIAKQIVPVLDFRILRAYGLVAHPNVLGGVGLIGLWIFFSRAGKNFGFMRWVILVSSSLIVLLSMSRNALLALSVSGLMCFGYRFYFDKRLSRTYIFSIVSSILILPVVAWFLSSTRLSTSDNYRFADLVRWFDFVRDHPYELLFGHGLGQYPLRLYDLGGLENWAYQPVHSAPLYLLISIGIVPLLIGFGCFLFKKKERLSLPKILYIQWYQAGTNERQREIEHAAKQNIESGLFDTVVVFHESGDVDYINRCDSKSRVVIKSIDARLTFEQVVKYAQSQKVHHAVLANTDIVFDDSIEGVQSMQSGESWVVTRREQGALNNEGRYDSLGNWYSHSQDVWIWKSNESIKKSDIQLGTIGCDNRIAYTLFSSGLSIRNVYELISVEHMHASQQRNYSPGSGEYSVRYFPGVGYFGSITVE